MSHELVKVVEALEKTASIKQKPKDRESRNKNGKKVILKKAPSKDFNIDYVEELKNQLAYGNLGHGLIVDKKV